MQFRVLGPLEVDAGDGAVPLGGPKQRAVLANLLVRANQIVPADTLIEDVWGDDPPGKARNTLQTYVSNLRKTLGDGLLQRRDPGYVLIVDPLDVDASRFDTLVREARKALPIDPKVAIHTLDDALALWRGPALADVADRALLAEAARLDELRLEAQEERVGALLATGSASSAIAELEPLLAQHPLRERMWEQLMLALYREGRQAEALGAFQRARELLADELGIDPSPELVRLHGQILAQDASLELRGEPLRGYRLLEKLGETRYGIRFRATQPRVGRDVEVEVLHEHVANSRSFVERFDAEAQAVAALEHPHIVPIYDYWREPGRAYLVWRHVRGPSLRTLVERGEVFEPGRALLVIEQVASALALAHRQGVAHGDLGDDHVIFDAEGNAYLGGFAIGVGPPPSEEDDGRQFEAMVRRLLGRGLPEQLLVLIDDAEPTQPARAAAFADAARAALISASLPAIAPSPTEALRNPYRGLRAFTEAEAPDFFGRSAIVRQVVDRFADADPDARFVAVVGPSGCGKSSLVRAGVVPALRDGALGEPVLVTELSPGAEPYEELEAALGRVAVRAVRRLGDVLRSSSRGLLEAAELAIPGDTDVVIVIDQFEELFTLTTDEAVRVDFLECVRVACADPDSRVRVIATLRADFYDRPLVYPRFGELLASRTEAIPPLQPDELEQAIRGPAERAGVSLEPGLVAAMIADAAHQPGALPLIQFTLTESFNRQLNGCMELATYRELGGIVGSLSASADEAVRVASRNERHAIRQVFLRLVTLGEGRSDTRRRVARGALDSLEIEDATIDRVLNTFGRLRILTFDREPATREPTIEIAHEALLDAWPRLRRWIDEAREGLRQERMLLRVAGEWLAAGQDPSFLLRGARLEQAEAWLQKTDLALGHDVRSYVVASIAERTRERDTDQQRRVRETEIERRSSRRLRALVAVFAAAALIAASLTLVATGQGRRAEREAAVSAVRELAAASGANLESDPELAVLLAVEAVERSRAGTGVVAPEAEQALHRAIAASRIVATIPTARAPIATTVDDLIAGQDAASPGRVAIFDLAGTPVRAFDAHEGEITDMAFASNGARLITAGSDGWLRAWDTKDGSLLWDQHGRGAVTAVTLDARGSLVAARWHGAGRILVLDARTGSVVRTISGLNPSNRLSPLAALSPDGTRIAMVTALQHGVETGRIVALSGRGRGVPFRAPRYAGINGELSWSPDGRYLSGSSFVWDTSTGDLLHTAEHGALVGSSSWSPDGSRLVTGSGETAEVWELGPNEFRPTLSLSAAGTNPVTDVSFVAGNAEVATASDAIRLWDVRLFGDAEHASLSLPTVYANGLGFTDAGTLVVAADTGEDAAAFSEWDPRDDTTASIGSPGKLALRPFDVNPIDGSPVLVNRDGSLSVITGRDARRLPFDVDGVWWAPDGVHLVMTTPDSVALVGLDGREVWRTTAPSSIGLLSVAEDGRVAVVTAADDVGSGDSVMVLDGSDGSVISTMALPVHVSGVSLVPWRDEVITATDDGPLQAWDTESAQLLGAYPAEATGGIALSADGATLATMRAEEQVVRVYDVATRQLRLALPQPNDLLGDGPGRAPGDPRCFAQGLAFNGDGSLLAAQGCAGVRVFALDIDELLAIARTQITRSFTAEECRRYVLGDCSPA